MKNSFVYIFVLSMFILSGCAYKIAPQNINRAILPNGFDDAKTFLSHKIYSTYDEKKAKITRYFFKNKEGHLKVSYVVEYIPYDYNDQLYSPFSNITFTLNRLTNHKAKTIEEALKQEVIKNNSTLLFVNKNEFIIGNKFANDLIFAIDEYNDKIDREEDDREKIIIIKNWPYALYLFLDKVC